MTSYTDVVSAFESIIKCKYVLADGLVRQWFLNALGAVSYTHLTLPTT